MQVSFVCVGDVTQDNFFFIDEATVQCDLNQENCTLDIKYGEKIPVKQFGVTCGGNAANVAVGLTKLGLATKLLTTFGDDERGAWLKRQLMEAGVDLEDSVTDQKRNSNLSGIIVFKGERTIMTYHAPGEDLIGKIPVAEWIYLSSSAGRDSTKIHQLVLGQKGEAKLAFNPSVGDLRRGREFLQPVLAATEVLILNKVEAGILLGKQESVEEMFAEITKMGPKIVAITDGKNGAHAYDGKNSIYLPAMESKILETTGAGDAFSSGFLAGLVLNNNDINEAMKWGVKNSSSVVTKLGGQEGLLTIDLISNS